MALTEENRANLEKLATYLERLPADYDHFTMWTYCASDDDEAITRYALKNGGLAKCGAVACAVGHGPAAGILLNESEITSWGAPNWNDYAARLIGSSYDENYEWAFDTLWTDYDNTHQGAAARIRYLLHYGKPPKRFEKPGDCLRAYKPFLKAPPQELEGVEQ